VTTAHVRPSSVGMKADIFIPELPCMAHNCLAQSSHCLAYVRMVRQHYSCSENIYSVSTLPIAMRRSFVSPNC